MCWEAVAAIAGILTVVAVLLGGGMMLWRLNKPKVYLLSCSPYGWYFIHRDSTKLIGIRIIATITIMVLKAQLLAVNLSVVFLTGKIKLHSTVLRILS